MSYHDLPCRNVVDLATDSLLGVLDLDQQLAIERHLVMCADCTEFFDQMRLSVRILEGLRHEEVPEQTVEALLVSFRQHQQPL